MRRYQLLAAIITFWLGVYFAFKLGPPAVSVFGADDVFIFWGWERIRAGLEGCIVASHPVACLFDFARLTATVPGLLARLTICCLGSALAAATFQWLRGSQEDDPQEDE